MNIDFRDIKEGWYNAEVSQIMEGTGPHGPFLRMIFTITEGELQHYRFSSFVKPSGLKQSRLYRWITIILGQEPENEFSTEELIGRDCLVYLSKRKARYTVIELCQKDMASIIASTANKPDCLSV